MSGNGQYLACSCADKASYTVKMPPTSGKVNAFVGMPTKKRNSVIVLLGKGVCIANFSPSGHDGAVLSTCWNHGGEWLLTCSTDKTARVWSSGNKDPLLTISTLRHNLTSTKDMKVSIYNTLP